MTDQQKDEIHTQGKVVTLASRNKRNSEEMEMIIKGEEMIKFLRDTADDLEKGEDICVNVLVIVKAVNLSKNLELTDVRSLSDDDSDLAMLARANDMILHR
jgi:hypothetical protein